MLTIRYAQMMLAALGALSWHLRLQAADHEYFGLRPPASPAPFSPALFNSLGPLVPVNLSFSRDLRHAVFVTINNETPQHSVLAIYETRFDGIRWSAPSYVSALHNEGYNSAEPSFSRDGKWLYFTSTQPPGTPPWTPKLFRAQVVANGFQNVQSVPLAMPANAGVYYPTPLGDGGWVFNCSELPGEGRDDFYYLPARADGTFGLPVALGGDFSSAQADWDLIEHPDGSLRLWASSRTGGAEQVDIFYSRRRSTGWSEARPLIQVNTPAVESAPRLSPDGKVLFFQRQRPSDAREQIYWVDLGSVLPDR